MGKTDDVLSSQNFFVYRSLQCDTDGFCRMLFDWDKEMHSTTSSVSAKHSENLI
jgi:hypothetical protein